MNIETASLTPGAAPVAKSCLTPDALKLEQIWVEALQYYNLNPAVEGREILSAILDAHSGPSRHYHNLQHLREVSDYLGLCQSQLLHPHELSLAILFHDFVYNPALKNNEEQSALVAVQALRQLNIPEEVINRVDSLIRATKTHQPVPGNPDSTYFLDADLAILGSEPARYAQYAADIRREYNSRPHNLYCERRVAVMSKFLERSPFYYHPIPAGRAAQAMDNIRAEIHLLRNSASGTSIDWSLLFSAA